MLRVLEKNSSFSTTELLRWFLPSTSERDFTEFGFTNDDSEENKITSREASHVCK